MGPEVMDEKWVIYREKNLEVQKIVQAKIKQKTKKWIAETRKKDKRSSNMFRKKAVKTRYTKGEERRERPLEISSSFEL